MTVYRRDGDEVVEVTVREHEIYRTPLLPGFELPLAKLLSLSDALDQAEAADGDDDS